MFKLSYVPIFPEPSYFIPVVFGVDKNRTLSNKHMERSSPLLFIRSMQIKAKMRYHYTLTMVAQIINTNHTNCCWRWRCGETILLIHCWEECKMIQPLWKIIWYIFFKNLNTPTILPSHFMPRCLCEKWIHMSISRLLHECS